MKEKAECNGFKAKQEVRKRNGLTLVESPATSCCMKVFSNSLLCAHRRALVTIAK